MTGAVLADADLPDRLALSLPASATTLGSTLDACQAFMQRHAVAARPLASVRLLVEEVVMNVAMHGGGTATRAPRVDLVIRMRPEGIELQIDDDGQPFDPSTAASPPRPTSLAEAVPGGTGLHLLRRFARAMQYERRDGRNRLTLLLDRA